MTRKEWIIVLLSLVIVWGLDRVTKLWAVDLQGIVSYFGVLHFSLHHNPGAMLGLFADLPAVLRVVTLSTAGAFLLCTYVLVQYLLPIKSLTLRVGMSILIAGIIGNVFDRIIWGHVVDFIVLGNVEWASPAFNVADMLQWVGYFMIIWAIIREGDLLWPENNVRKVYWVNPQFQLKYCFILLGVGLTLSLITMVFSYTYLRVTMVELIGNNTLLKDKFLIPFAITYVAITIGFSVGLFTVGKVISHKIAGPVYAFEKYLLELIDDAKNPAEARNFKLRSQDEFKQFERLAALMKQAIVKNSNWKPEPQQLEMILEDKAESTAPAPDQTKTNA